LAAAEPLIAIDEEGGDVTRIGHLAGSYASDLAAAVDAGLAAAEGGPLVVVVRDVHRYPGARNLVTRLVAARPDTVVVEMGFLVWRPPRGGYVATYGAARISALAAAEILGLAPARG
jgi:hypothetical protein